MIIISLAKHNWKSNVSRKFFFSYAYIIKRILFKGYLWTPFCHFNASIEKNYSDERMNELCSKRQKEHFDYDMNVAKAKGIKVIF